MPRRRAFPGSVLLLALAVSACGDDPDPVRQSVATADFVADVRDWSTTIDWYACEIGAECGSIEVPFDYSRPELGVFTLPVTRRPASNQDDRIGSLIINPGGPGGSGVDFAFFADGWASSTLLERFDIVGWDPRGVGGSSPAVDCVDTMYDYFALDPSPDDADEESLLLGRAAEFAAECHERSGNWLPYVNTTRAAADIDVLRRALGEDTVSYLGFSYGTLLGATWISLFPDTVRAAVLDAAVDPTTGYIDGLVGQAGGFETSLDGFLADCDERGCSFMKDGETAGAAFDRIAASLDSRPIANGFLDDGTELPPTNQGILATAVAVSLYGDYSWGSLEDALDAADSGDGLPLLLLFDSYFGITDGVPEDSIDMYFGVTCADRGRSVDPSRVLAARERLMEAAPRLGAGWIQEMLLCANWVVPPARNIAIGADTAVPSLVVGSIGDAATPLAGTINMVETLGDARLIVSPLRQHTTYGSDPCVTELVDAYLSNPTGGPDVIEC